MTLKVAAIIGYPVAQSLSPAKHNAVFRERKLDWSYIAMEVREDALSEVLRTLRDKDIKALSVTMPHKEAVFELLSNASNGLGDVDESARAARSVNTIVVSGEQLIGSNTDGDGCCNAIKQAGVDVAGSRAVVVGAVVVGMCVVALATPRVVEGMAATTPLDALKTQINALQTRYDTLDNSITAQTNTITGHSHTLYKILSDAPTQSNNITHANVNMDDPSKTPMKNISMS